MVCGYRSKYLLHNYDWKRHNIAIHNDCQSGTVPWKIVSKHVIRLIIFHKMAEVGDHQIPPSRHKLMYQYDGSPKLVRSGSDSQKGLSPLWCNNNYEKIDKKESSSVWAFLRQCFAECFTGWGSCTFGAIKDQWRKGRMRLFLNLEYWERHEIRQTSQWWSQKLWYIISVNDLFQIVIMENISQIRFF